MLQYTYDPKRFSDLFFRRVPLISLMTLYKCNSKGPSIKDVGIGVGEVQGLKNGQKMVKKWSKIPTR